MAYENKKDSYKKAYANDPEKFKKASKIVTMLILKRKGKYQKRLTKKTPKSVKKLLIKDYYYEHREEVCSKKRKECALQ